MPNEDGRRALYTLSTYSLESHSEGKEIRILDLESGETALFSDDPQNKDIQWLGTDRVLWSREVPGGLTELWSGMAIGEKEYAHIYSNLIVKAQVISAYLVTTIDGIVSNLRTKKLSNGTFAVVVTGKASPDGTFYNPKSAKQLPSSAREYDTFSVRIWDAYVTPERYTLWYTVLEQSPERSDRYSIAQTGFVNALKGTDLEPPNPNTLLGVDSDIGTNGILFVAKDPSVNQVMKYKDDLYFLALSSFKEDPAPAPQKISVPGFHGTANSATFSPDGKSAAFLQRKDQNNVYDRGYIFIVDNIDKLDHFTEIVTSTSDEVWDLWPETLAFSVNARELYITAESRGSKKLFKIQMTSPTNGSTVAVPSPITTNGVVSSPHGLSPTRVFVTISTLTSSSSFTIIDTSSEKHANTFVHPQNTPNFSHHAPHVSQINFQGAGDYKVQAFIVKPPDFTKDKTYPMLLWIHGGPVSSWTDAWSYRWNAALFAELGYIVIMPNITGSIGFGQKFIDGIGGEWGGRTYQDLVNCFEYVKETMPFVDTKRAIAMGASYGGYMINWYDCLPPIPVLTLPNVITLTHVLNTTPTTQPN